MRPPRQGAQLLALASSCSRVGRFEAVSGCKLNRSKTVGLVSCPDKEGVLEGVKLVYGNDKLLGVPVGAGINEAEMWKAPIDKMRKKFNFWKTRDLTLEGKAYIAASLGLSQVTYMIDLKDVPHAALDEIRRECTNFLLDRNRPVTITEKQTFILKRKLFSVDLGKEEASQFLIP